MEHLPQYYFGNAKFKTVTRDDYREGRIEVQYDSKWYYLDEGDFICDSKDRTCTLSTFSISYRLHDVMQCSTAEYRQMEAWT